MSAIALVVSGGLAGVGYLAFSSLSDMEERVADIESTNNVNEFILELNEDAYQECIDESWDDYSEAWDRKCWSLGDNTDCMLTIADRYQVEHDYQNEIMGCLAEYK